MSDGGALACPRCDARVEDLAAKFCPSCGTRLVGGATPRPARPARRKEGGGDPTPLGRSWLHLAGFGIVGLGLCTFAVFNLQEAGANPWGIGAAVLGLSALVGALVFKAGPCPACGAHVSIAAYERCSSCREFLRVDGALLRIAEAGHVAAAPAFEVRLGLLSIPTAVAWPWPDRCAVCGEPATRTVPLEVRQGTGRSGMMIEVTTWTIPVPHCAHHEGGVAWRTSSPSDSTDGRTMHQLVSFRSVDHARAFEEANRERVD